VRGITERELVVDDQNPDRRVNKTRRRHRTMVACAEPPVHGAHMCT
jgi:hypothetical protein